MRHFIISLLLSVSVAATAEAPSLTDIQRLTLTNKYLQYELARLRLDAAQADLLTYIRSLEKEGFTLDVNTGTYTAIK